MSAAVYRQKGHNIDWTNATGADVAYLDVVGLTNRIGIAQDDIPQNAVGILATTGVWELPAVNTTAFGVGDALYWDAANGVLTKTSEDNIPAGWAVAPKAQAGTTGQVKID